SGERSPRERNLQLVGRRAEPHRLIELDLRRDRVALLEQGEAQQIARLAVVRVLLQQVLQLDDRGAEVAPVHVLLGRGHQGGGILAAAAPANRRGERQGKNGAG